MILIDNIIGILLLLVGLGFMIVGSLGILRLPDFFYPDTRGQQGRHRRYRGRPDWNRFSRTGKGGRGTKPFWRPC